MDQPNEQTQDLLNRLRSIEGHVRGVTRMVEEGSYCIEIIKQTMAIQRAIDKVNALILERHLATCVTTAIRGDSPAERERVLKELMDIFDTTRKL